MKKKVISTLAVALAVLVAAVVFDHVSADRYSGQLVNFSAKAARRVVSWFVPPPDLASLPVEDAAARQKLPLYKTIAAAQPGELTRANGYPKRDSYINWHRSHGDMGSSRYSLLDQINRSNVKDLQVAWIYRSGDGTPEIKVTPIEASPVIANGVIYTPTPGHFIAAVNAMTGKEIWRFKSPENFPAKRGLIWWAGTKNIPARIYFPAGDLLIALDAKTGALVHGFGKEGFVRSYKSSIAPTIARGRIVIGTFKPSIEAFDLITGKKDWSFDILDKSGSSIFDMRPHNLSGGNPWGGMATDVERGIVYVSTGNPEPAFIGVVRPGENRNTSSVVALDIESGRKIWSFQEVRHDLWDLDIPASPVLTTITRGGQRIDVVATVTKVGNTLLLDRVTGKPIFPFRLKRVATSTIPGEITSPYQPAVELPEPFARQEFTLNDVTNIGEANRNYVLSKLRDANYGFFRPHKIGQRSVFFGSGGGGEWPGATVDQETGVLYVSSNDMPWEMKLENVDVTDETALPSTEGRTLFLNHCAVCHGRNREGGVGPRLVDVEREHNKEEIKSIVRNGRRGMPAISGLTDRDLDQLSEYLLDRDKFIAHAGLKRPYEYKAIRAEGFRPFKDQEGYPASKPPWGLLNAIDLNTGKLLWRVPLGEYSELTERGVPITGTMNFGGATVTAGGIVFVAGTTDLKFRAFDKATGKELWSYKLPFGGFAPPATYEVDGRQYVVIPAFGGHFLSDSVIANMSPADKTLLPGDALVAFSLPVH
jgi:quinoprotein glucose dehydrogenase